MHEPELDPLERRFLIWGLVDFFGPAHCTEAMAIAIGFRSVEDFARESEVLIEKLTRAEALSTLDWRRVLLAAEVCFASNVVGSGLDWSITFGHSDEVSIRLLRSLQRKLSFVHEIRERMTEVRIRKLSPLARDLVRGTSESAGFDLCAALEAPMTIKPGEIAAIPTGIAMAMPSGFEAQVRPRSGLALKFGVTVLNSPGTIDADYRGEVKVIAINHGKSDFVIQNGERIAQVVFATLTVPDLREVEVLDDTARGGGGFGSTGR